MISSPWPKFALTVLFMLVASGALLSACSTAPNVLTAVLGAPVKPAIAQGKQRRPTYKPWEDFSMEYNLVPPEKTDWPAKLALLPKDASDGIDWVKALDSGAIKPKPGLDEKAEEEPVAEMVVELTPKDAPDFKATFTHKPHTQLLACASCHSGLFQMEAGADPITMEKINGGEYCGRCHGPVAFEATACPRCHLGMS